MTIVAPWRPLAAALLALALAACTNVPQGFGSGEFTIIRRVRAPVVAVWEAAREFLRDRGDTPDVIAEGDGGVLMTGDLRIEVKLGDEEGESRLVVHQAKYVGPDYEERCVAVADGIVARVR